MCEGVDVCPGTGESKDKAPCRVAMNFGVPETIEIIKKSLPQIIQTAGGNGTTARSFFSEGWTNK